jgi:hypothetical protein
VATEPSAEVKGARNHTSTFRYTFMTWWLVRHTGNYACKFVAGNGVVEVVLRTLIGYDFSVSRGWMSPRSIDRPTIRDRVSNRLLRDSKAKVLCRSA